MTISPACAEPAVEHVRSADGTRIAFERLGDGPAVILVDPALCDRGMGQSRQLARHLAPDFTVLIYDRRGRGRSGDTPPYAPGREVDDIAALLEVAGGSAAVWGMSSGAVLALDAARELPGITRVAAYEAPLIVDESRAPMDETWRIIEAAIAAGRQGEAVKTFLRATGVPAPVLLGLRLTPMWRKLERLAPTLRYDAQIVRAVQRGHPLPVERWRDVRVPVLVMDGGRSPEWFHRGSEALARVLPNATHLRIEGRTHRLVAGVHAPILRDFFTTASAVLPS